MTRTIRRVSVLLTVLFICGPFTHAAPEREGRTVEINGIEMYYEVMGEGDPLVLLHGWSGTGHDFDPFVEEFARHYRLIIPDLRGHGGSNNPSGEFSIKQVAKDVAALLRQLEIDRIRAIGASMGGITLLHMASLEQAPQIESMVLVGAGHRFTDPCRESMAETTIESFNDRWWTTMRSRHNFGDEQIKSIAGLLNVLAADTTDVAFSRTQLTAIESRTLLVFGDRDWCFPVSLAVELYDAMTNASLWVVPGGGHVPITGDHAGRFTETALEFLAGE